MGKRAENVFFNGGFQGIIDNCDEMHVCSAEPTTYTEASSTNSLGSVSMVGGDYTEADGDVSGRKLTVSAKTINGSSNGTGTHLALVDTVGSELYYVTTCTSVAISTGVDQDFSAWDIEIQDPS